MLQDYYRVWPCDDPKQDFASKAAALDCAIKKCSETKRDHRVLYVADAETRNARTVALVTLRGGLPVVEQ